MQKSRTLLTGCATFLLAASGTPAGAGPNANGTLIAHLHDIVTCFDGVVGFDICQTPEEQDPLATCSEATVRWDNGPYPTQIWGVYAAFPPVASPRLAGVAFGIDYDDTTLFLVDWSGCGDFELSTNDWPTPGEGTAVTWAEAQTDGLVHVYGFAGYEYYGNPTLFELIPHPTQGAVFADDDVPSNLDAIADLGAIGFNTDGYLPCPDSEPGIGACCYADCTCEVWNPIDCEAAGGIFMGDGTVCDPNPCPCPPTGACCLDGDCTMQTEAECAAIGGLYIGDEVPCDPNPCPVPTVESSWGRIKDRYR